MKILAMCGNGLGSSFMIKLNVQKVVKELGIDATVENTDLTTGKTTDADIYIAAADIAGNFNKDGAKVVALGNIMDTNEIKEKISQYL